MTKTLAASALALLLTAACGGKTDDNTANTGGGGGAGATGGSSGSGGSGGASGGSGGATGGSGGMPVECSVPTTEPGPFPTKIRFVNPGPTPLFIREDCQLNWDLYSCADGYTTEVPHVASCMSSCAEPNNGCIACGACMLEAHEVTSAAPVETEWSGHSYSFSQKNSCQCYNEHNVLPGKYAIKIQVFTSKDDVTSYAAGYEAWAYFELPAKNGVVEVSLVPPVEG
ncbi:MAG: hypothetical protein IT377_22330 [Polyangiaceae bacterium]|nr:hypothetical protein [Polyangiaceae bacterium]